MSRCSRCGAFTNNGQEPPWGVVRCSDCKRQDAMMEAQRRAVLETTPQGRAQLAKERKNGCIGKVLGLIFVFALIVVASLNSSNTKEPRPEEKNIASDVDTAPRNSQISSNTQQSRFVVVNISDGDFLNVREQPNASGKIVGKLPRGAMVTSSGQKERKGSDTWIYISSPVGSGWVNIRFLKNI
jgi:hypothetical protein